MKGKLDFLELFAGSARLSSSLGVSGGAGGPRASKPTTTSTPWDELPTLPVQERPSGKTGPQSSFLDVSAGPARQSGSRDVFQSSNTSMSAIAHQSDTTLVMSGGQPSNVQKWGYIGTRGNGHRS